ncbi:MAG: hypothetical protein LBG78_02860 [Azoarcus sp.]|jgi:hypothetical protein|nr:hypothetical protein [Azoarcus sp.]
MNCKPLRDKAMNLLTDEVNENPCTVTGRVVTGALIGYIGGIVGFVITATAAFGDIATGLKKEGNDVEAMLKGIKIGGGNGQ